MPETLKLRELRHIVNGKEHGWLQGHRNPGNPLPFREQMRGKRQAVADNQFGVRGALLYVSPLLLERRQHGANNIFGTASGVKQAPDLLRPRQQAANVGTKLGEFDSFALHFVAIQSTGRNARPVPAPLQLECQREKWMKIAERSPGRQNNSLAHVV